jgi:hypothetical protein
MSKESTSLAVTHKDGKWGLAGSASGVLAALTLILTAFVIYMNSEAMKGIAQEESEAFRRIEERQNAVAEMRIQQCHSIQEQALVVMQGVTDAYHEQANLAPMVEDFTQRMEQHMKDQTLLLHEIRSRK